MSGNYRAMGERGPVTRNVLPPYSNPTTPMEGPGSPEGVVIGVAGAQWKDTITSEIYLKLTGTGPNGWVKVENATGLTGGSAGSGASGSQIFSVTADPNGVLSITGTGLCLGTGAIAGAVWSKSTTGTSSEEWEPIIAAP